jgi:predicted DCC family thiol-disulfide oxidoreductase YuxK
MSERVTSAPSAGGRLLAGAWRVWSSIWFQEAPTTPLEVTRIGLGIAMLLHYGMASQYLLTFWGDNGWMTRDLLANEIVDPFQQSVFFYFAAPWQWIAFHALFLFCIAAFMLGWRTWLVKWVVLIGHLSFAYRNPVMTYGVDSILACLLLIECFAPVGRALSLDRVREVRRAKRKYRDTNLGIRPPPYTSEWAFACMRLMQIQMALLFFFSGIGKLKGDDWWDGSAIWRVFTDSYFHSDALLAVLASQYWIVNVATYSTIVIEISYAFLIWQRATRPYLLVLGIFLHLQFALLMYLHYFSWVMIMGHMSFLRPEWLQGIGAWWKRRIGPMEMIYDGHCGFCKRSMAWFLAFDGLDQIQVRDFRANPSQLISDEQMLKALYLVLPNGRAMPGFEAYRYVVLRVPGLWWQIPFFYVPVFSRLIGTPTYYWFARNRSRL